MFISHQTTFLLFPEAYESLPKKEVIPVFWLNKDKLEALFHEEEYEWKDGGWVLQAPIG